jgi:hypothetical protein
MSEGQLRVLAEDDLLCADGLELGAFCLAGDCLLKSRVLCFIRLDEDRVFGFILWWKLLDNMKMVQINARCFSQR